MNVLLTLCEYIWAVTYQSADSGYTLTHSYWTNQDKADSIARRLNNGHVVQTTLHRDHSNRYYKVISEEVDVDMPDKNEVLKKLTDKERKVLGL